MVLGRTNSSCGLVLHHCTRTGFLLPCCRRIVRCLLWIADQTEDHTALSTGSCWCFLSVVRNSNGTPHPGKSSDISLLMLALTCIAAIMKLGTAKVSCSQFFTMLPEITGKLMDTLIDLQPIQQAYASIKKVGLKSEFLSHFGSRAASCRVRNDRDTEEVIFWVNLVQKQLQRATDRERIWSRLTTSESIEVHSEFALEHLLLYLLLEHRFIGTPPIKDDWNTDKKSWLKKKKISLPFLVWRWNKMVHLFYTFCVICTFRS